MFSVEKLLLSIFLQLSNKLYNDPRNRIEQLLDSAGDGSGTTEMVDDTPQAFFIQPPPGEIYFLNRLNVYIEDDGKFDAALYGSVAALANGIICTVEDENGNLKTLTPEPITKIGLWDLVSGIDMLFTNFEAAANDMVAVRWSFFKGGGSICLIGDNGEKFVMNVQDELGVGGAALDSHIVQVQGFSFRPPKWWGLNLPKAT